MANWPEFRPTSLLKALTARGVDFVVIGGYAAIAHGSPELTNDLDICFAQDAANLEVLGDALLELRARPRGVEEEDLPFTPDATTLRQVQLLTLDTDEGPIDLLAQPDGAPGYATLRRRAERVEIGGIAVLVASLDDLMSMKHASGRPGDLITLEQLKAIKRLRRRVIPRNHTD